LFGVGFSLGANILTTVGACISSSPDSSLGSAVTGTCAGRPGSPPNSPHYNSLVHGASSLFEINSLICGLISRLSSI
jgi:hypothetical protein